MTYTREFLIDQASDLIRNTGYAGFSYADLSDAVGLNKSSIHHYFRRKSDLGLAIVISYRRMLIEQLDEIYREETDVAKRLSRYAEIYRSNLLDGKGCLCGVLAAEFANLPDEIQESVIQFFEFNIKWLEKVLADGPASIPMSPHQCAKIIHATLQGASLVSRAEKDIQHFDAVAGGIIAMSLGT